MQYKYDFDKIVDRRETYSYKWDIKENEVPMWVADMDFRTAPEIVKALEERVSNGIFGYTYIPDEWNEAYVNWWKKRHHFEMEKENLIFSTGVVPAISSAVRKLTTANENVVLLTPVYNIFFNSIINNGCRVSESALIYEDYQYRIDFEDLEERLKDPQTSLLIFCNPHNPIGKIWTKEEMERVGELCKEHHVTVISDEIHCDIVDPGYEYIPFASVSDTCKDISITCLAPSKTFNLAGLHTACVYVSNPVLRHKMYRALNTDEVAEPNAFAMQATIAAFSKGENWLQELCCYIKENKSYATDFIEKELPDVKVVSGPATYLLWVDCRNVGKSGVNIAEFIREKTGLYVSPGEHYGKAGKDFIRINLACPLANVKKGMELLKEGINLL